MSAFEVRPFAADEPLVDDDDTLGILDFGALNDDILKELQRRLGDPKLREGIPGTTLMQLARDILKSKEREEASRVEVLEEDLPLSVIIAQAGLPAERKRELVRAQILEEQAELDRLTALLEQLEDE